jgi:hypothetical protein
MLWQVFGKRHFEVGLSELARLVVDRSANVGYTSVYLAERSPKAVCSADKPRGIVT